MEISRFDAGAEQLATEPVDLVELVTTVATARLPEAVRSMPSNLVVVESDPRRIERIVGNLLDNAKEHAAGAPVEVRVELGRDGASAVVGVADRGPGIPPDQLTARLRPLLQGRPVAPRRQQRPGPRDRRGARDAAGRRAHARATARAAACASSCACL